MINYEDDDKTENFSDAQEYLLPGMNNSDNEILVPVTRTLFNNSYTAFERRRARLDAILSHMIGNNAPSLTELA